ncbi:MAG: RNB domain-containing ribonuclease [Treponema sp.]|nr:RNB domain-containing ribonuclease [Treponema sp.]
MATNDITLDTNTIVLYKSTAAAITDKGENGKFPIRWQSAPATATKPATYSQQSVRTKDFTILSTGAASSLERVLEWAEKNAPSEEDMYGKDTSNALAAQVKECYELLCSDEETASAAHSFEDLVSLFRGEVKADECWGNYLALKNTVYFKQDLKELMDGRLVFTPRPQAEIDELVKKADAKGQEAQKREEFLARLKERKLLPEDSIFMTDVENLAYSKTDKSRTMHDAHLKETPENAHKLLLETGIWDITRNPYPIRWGLSMKSATEGLAAPPDEERLSVEGISYAIDNEYSTDPDDAVAWDGSYLWVHIADPASTVMPDSSIDKSARARGATLYLPEGAARMLAEDCLEDYALGLKEQSRALSFRIQLDAEGNIEDCSVFKTLVNVKRLTYKQADTMKGGPELKKLFEIAKRNVERRVKAGAVMIDIPQVHITLDADRRVSIEEDNRTESSEMIREMMLLAGEGAAHFAFKNRIPFPFISQDAPTLPQDLPEGLAGQFRLRRCMHKRSVGITPAMHSGLGLGMYTQVTSPLRRYSDLIAHEQLRAFLDGRQLINRDDMLMRISEGDAGFQAAHKAERKTDMHWTLVYLLQNPDWTGDAILVDRGGKQPQLFIPELGLETYMGVEESVALNGTVRVKVDKINLSEQTVEFVRAEA